MQTNEILLQHIAVLEHRLGLLEDRAAIERLQYQYGFYLDNRMWREVGDLFAESGASIEIGRRGNYLGKERVHLFLQDVLGQGRWGLQKNEIINHIQMQLVTTVAEDRQSARARCRAIVQGNSLPGTGSLLWAEGIYENEYIKENGVWKIQRIWWAPTFYVLMSGMEKAVFQSAPVDEKFPPDAPSSPEDVSLGRSFIPFHYTHPITGASVPAPSVMVRGGSVAEP
jgi:hypothetical protein